MGHLTSLPAESHSVGFLLLLFITLELHHECKFSFMLKFSFLMSSFQYIQASVTLQTSALRTYQCILRRRKQPGFRRGGSCCPCLEMRGLPDFGIAAGLAQGFCTPLCTVPTGRMAPVTQRPRGEIGRLISQMTAVTSG